MSHKQQGTTEALGSPEGEGKNGVATVLTMKLLEVFGSSSPCLAHPLTLVAGGDGEVPSVLLVVPPGLTSISAMGRLSLCRALREVGVASVSHPTAFHQEAHASAKLRTLRNNRLGLRSCQFVDATLTDRCLLLPPTVTSRLLSEPFKELL